MGLESWGLSAVWGLCGVCRRLVTTAQQLPLSTHLTKPHWIRLHSCGGVEESNEGAMDWVHLPAGSGGKQPVSLVGSPDCPGRQSSADSPDAVRVTSWCPHSRASLQARKQGNSENWSPKCFWPLAPHSVEGLDVRVMAWGQLGSQERGSGAIPRPWGPRPWGLLVRCSFGPRHL